MELFLALLADCSIITTKVKVHQTKESDKQKSANVNGLPR